MRTTMAVKIPEVDYEALQDHAVAYYFAKALEEKAPEVLRFAKSNARQEFQTVDQVIGKIWSVCLEYDEEGWSNIEMRAHHDQWWGVSVECPHGVYSGVSDGMTDLSTGI